MVNPRKNKSKLTPSQKRRRAIRGSSRKRRRTRLIERDGPFCTCCQIEDTNLEIHHIKKRCDGGTNDLDNLCLMCHRCHVYWHQIETKNFWLWIKQTRKYLQTFLGENYQWKMIL